MANDQDPESKQDAEKMEKVWKRTKSRAQEALDWSRRISKVGKLKLDSTRMQKNRAALFQELGKKSYDLLKEGRFDPSALDQIVTQIDELSQKIDGQQKEIEVTAKK